MRNELENRFTDKVLFIEDNSCLTIETLGRYLQRFEACVVPSIERRSYLRIAAELNGTEIRAMRPDGFVAVRERLFATQEDLREHFDRELMRLVAHS